MANLYLPPKGDGMNQYTMTVGLYQFTVPDANNDGSDVELTFEVWSGGGGGSNGRSLPNEGSPSSTAGGAGGQAGGYVKVSNSYPVGSVFEFTVGGGGNWNTDGDSSIIKLSSTTILTLTGGERGRAGSGTIGTGGRNGSILTNSPSLLVLQFVKGARGGNGGFVGGWSENGENPTGLLNAGQGAFCPSANWSFGAGGGGGGGFFPTGKGGNGGTLLAIHTGSPGKSGGGGGGGSRYPAPNVSPRDSINSTYGSKGGDGGITIHFKTTNGGDEGIAPQPI